MGDGKKLFGAFAVAIALFFFWPAIVGSWQEVSALRQAVADREALLSKRNEILGNIASAYQDYTAKLSTQDGEKFGALVPIRKNQAELISAIEEIAGSSGVALDQVTISDGTGSTEASAYKTFSLSLNLTGTYDALQTFLSNVEQYVRLLNISSIDVSQGGATSNTLTFAIRADTYFLK